MKTNHLTYYMQHLKDDVRASVVVFLVAIPLCLGIALASGAPLFSGLIAGIIGGIVVTLASGSQLSVSGPAAGLAVIVFMAIETLQSFQAFLVAVVLAGILQIVMGYLKAGTIWAFFPSSVIKAMLAAIGLILIIKQIPHAFGYDDRFEGDESYMQELNSGDIKNRYTSPTFADLDGNGILDLYTGTLRNNLLYFPNDGNMLFGFHTNVKESGKSIIIDNNTNPAFADIDGDGDLDLYIGSDNGNIKYYENNNGEYTLQGNLQADGSDINLGAVIYPTFADFDNDGDLDLFIGENSGNIGYYNNNGSGVFSFVSQIEANGNTIDVGTDATPVFADIDDDGDLDLFVGSNYGDIHYYKNNGSGTLDSIGLLQAGGSNINVTSYSNPTFADIDGDGDLDLFVGNDTGNIYFYKNLSFISNAGEDAEEVCSMSYTLNANEPDPDKTGTWSIVSSNTGTFDDVNSYNAVFTADTEDTYILRWTVSDGSNTVSDDVQIIFSPDAENPTITCVGNQEVNANSNHNYIVNGTEFDPVSTNDNCAVASVMNDINSSTTLAAETLSEGTTTVTWTVYDEAGNSSVCSFDILVNAYVGIKNITGSGIHIFPNPVNDFVTVDINNPANSKNVKIQVCNILGEILIENMVSQNKEKIDLSELKPGMYIVNVLTDNRIFTSKIIKK
ncbi:MAG: FG-GAP-like repeat-containing protein [Bacteroidales bacterium]|nr:FG-GAP-like repeat-containing protein [Bacteroidales bacterium]